MVVALDTQLLGESVRWEAASGGDVFPHVYADVPLSAVAATYPVSGASSVDAALPIPG